MRPQRWIDSFLFFSLIDCFIFMLRHCTETHLNPDPINFDRSKETNQLMRRCVVAVDWDRGGGLATTTSSRGWPSSSSTLRLGARCWDRSPRSTTASSSFIWGFPSSASSPLKAAIRASPGLTPSSFSVHSSLTSPGSSSSHTTSGM